MKKSRVTAEACMASVTRCNSVLEHLETMKAPVLAQRSKDMNVLAVYVKRGIISPEEYAACRKGGAQA